MFLFIYILLLFCFDYTTCSLFVHLYCSNEFNKNHVKVLNGGLLLFILLYLFIFIIVIFLCLYSIIVKIFSVVFTFSRLYSRYVVGNNDGLLRVTFERVALLIFILGLLF